MFPKKKSMYTRFANKMKPRIEMEIFCIIFVETFEKRKEIKVRWKLLKLIPGKMKLKAFCGGER